MYFFSGRRPTNNQNTQHQVSTEKTIFAESFRDHDTIDDGLRQGYGRAALKKSNRRNKGTQQQTIGSEFNVYIEYIGKETPTQINQVALENHYNQIKSISQNMGIPEPADWFSILLKMPDVIKSEAPEADEAEWQVVFDTIQKATNQLRDFRIQEGNMLEKLFEQKINNIAQLLKEVENYERERIDKIKGRILENLEKLLEKDYDKNRLEQEMIYYIEKLDINEEKNRLDNHLKYFLTTMANGHGQGKKLGFIAQEMGREINTLGSKSNHAEMQKIVVQMKDELEQIKEQVLNVL